MAEAFEQQPGQFRRITYRRGIVKTVPGMVADTGLGGVGEDKTDIRIVRQAQKFIVIVVGANFAVYRTNKTRIANRFALFIQSANNRGIEAVLSAQRRREIAGDGSDDDHASIQVSMLVKQVNLPVNKRAQEVTFAKLDDTFRVLRAGEITTV